MGNKSRGHFECVSPSVLLFKCPKQNRANLPNLTNLKSLNQETMVKKRSISLCFKIFQLRYIFRSDTSAYMA